MIITLRTLLILILPCSIMAEDERPSAVMSPQTEDFLIDYCYDCHDDATQKGRVNLEKLNYDLGADLITAEHWQEVLDSINSGEMPPKKKSQPSDDEKAAFLEELSNKMVEARRIHAEDGGKITLRRLNRREYANSIYALTGIRPHVSHLPSDSIEDSFDTLGASLFMSSGQFEQYLAVAQKALKQATFSDQKLPAKTVRVDPEKKYGREKLEKHLKHYQDLLKKSKKFQASKTKDPEKYGLPRGHNPRHHIPLYLKFITLLTEMLSREETHYGVILTMINEILGPHHVTSPHIKRHPNQKVTIRMRAGAYHDVDPRFNYIEIVANDLRSRNSSVVAWQKFTHSPDKAQIVEIPVELDDSEVVNFRAHLRSYPAGSARDSGIARKRGDIHTPLGLWVDWMEVHVAEADSGYTPQMAALFTEKPPTQSEEDYARDILKRFAQKAFRTHPADAVYLDKLVKNFQEQRKAGAKLKDAIVDQMALILTSPSFLYMNENTPETRTAINLTLIPDLLYYKSKTQTKPINNYELAVRLSYFLWSSPPDEILLDLAREGRLAEETVLHQQVDRMLKDEKAMHFIEGFCYQWLGMDRLGLFPFDTHRHNGFDKAVLDSAAKEVYHSIAHLIQNNLPSRNLIDADYIIINDVLADHYNLSPKVIGSHFRKHKIAPSTPRGGLLSTTAVLAMGSDGKESSPVERGVWILRHILDQAPPPAPPNVPQLDRLKDGFISHRDILQLHQEAPQCAQCHHKIDPVGLGLEQFDAAGRWRKVEIAEFEGKKKELAIDPSGHLPSGAKFQNFFELREAIYQEHDRFARILTEELISYGLGRTYQFTDEPLTQQILATSQQNGYTINDIIKGIVTSHTFQKK